MYKIKFLLRITKGNMIFLFKKYMVRRYVITITVYLNLHSIFPITYIRSKGVQNPSQCSMETSRKLVIRSKAK